MANIRKGVCKNYDECNMADSKEIQEIKSGEQFICEECRRPLVEASDKGPGGGSSKMKYIIIAVVTILLVGGGGAFFKFQDKPTADPEPVTDSGTITDSMTVITDSVTIDTLAVEEELEQVETTTPPAASATNATSGTIDLGYAIYTGDIKNGKPHGNGTLEYKKSQKIIGSKDYVASPGEKVIGSFRDGKINLATWYQKDGNQVVIK